MFVNHHYLKQGKDDNLKRVIHFSLFAELESVGAFILQSLSFKTIGNTFLLQAWKTKTQLLNL